ncbi:MAG: tRNA lysidine(34) synthetase TilS, partial [Alphaproteobacteria bacterium]
MVQALDHSWFLAALAAASGGHPDLVGASTAPVAVAVSGGADSMALVLLAAQALGAARVRALSVDHGLRTEAAAEARQVGAWLAPLGIAHRVLVWHGDRPHSNVQERARAAR